MEYQPKSSENNIEQNPNNEVNECGNQMIPIQKGHYQKDTFVNRVRSRKFNVDPTPIELSVEVRRINEESKLILELSEIERKPRKIDGERENDAEHTLMLGMIAQRFAHEHRPDLDVLKVRTMCDLHDKVEIYTGDVATYSISEADLLVKKQAEARAMPLLMRRLTEENQNVLEEYEAQETKEARFVRMFDKIMPYLVDFQGDGVRVLIEDYGVKSVADYSANDDIYARRLKEEYEEPELNILHIIRQAISDEVKSQLGLHFELQEVQALKDELEYLIETQGRDDYTPEWDERDDIEMLEDVKLKEEGQDD